MALDFGIFRRDFISAALPGSSEYTCVICTTEFFEREPAGGFPNPDAGAMCAECLFEFEEYAENGWFEAPTVFPPT